MPSNIKSITEENGETIVQVHKTYQRLAYEAYAESTGGKTFDGRPMPTWDELPERIQLAWRKATEAAINAAHDVRNAIDAAAK